MTDLHEPTREALPDVAAGRADDQVRARVLAHVAGCAACAGELRLLEALYAGRPALSEERAERIARVLLTGASPAGVSPVVGPDGGRFRRRRWLPTWTLAAAAMAGLALGTPLLVERMGSGEQAADAGGDLDVTGNVWLSEDPMVAGGPVFESLTDDQLAQLLEEMDG